MNSSRLNFRGFTLVELLVAVAVASVIVLAAVLSASSIFSLSQGQARRSSAEAALALASVSLDRSVSNAGAAFANSRYAVRIRNNVSVGATLSGNLIAVAGGGASAGLVAGTDVIELSWGNAMARRAGSVASTGSLTLTGGSSTLNLQNNDPLADEEWSGVATLNPPVMLVTRERAPQEACLVGVSLSGIPRRLKVDTVLDEDFSTAGGTCTVQADALGNDIVAYKLDERVRLFVYQQANGAEIGLYRQSMDPSSGDFVDISSPGNAPQVVALGVENLQIAPVLGPNTDGGFPGVGSCSTAFCRCADGADGGAACSVSEGGGFSGAGPTAVNSLIRALDAEVTVIGDRRQGERRPASFDSPASPVDGRRRAVARVSINVINGYLFAQ